MAKGYPHAAKAKRYAREVFNGKRIAGRYTWLACKRFLEDLERGEWLFSPRHAERACRFIEQFDHVKGKWAGNQEKLQLDLWQCFFVVNVFGWLDRETKKRRFTEAYLRVARKNGKSTLAAPIGLYMFVADEEYGAEVYSGATSEKQAWEVFRPAKQMAERQPEFCEFYDVDVRAKNMHRISDDSRFEPMIGNPGDGSSPHCAIIDEYHEHNSPAMYDTMVTGMAAREQPLTLIITTAGTNLASPCFEKDDDCKKVLEGTFKDDSLFALIYEPDKDDIENWQSVRAMKKANPSLGVSVSQSYLERRISKALRSPSELAAYKTKHLNIWQGSGQAFLNMHHWEQCGDAALTAESLVDKPCIFGIDLASRIDFVALVKLFFERLDDDNLGYYAIPTFWLPENRVEEDATGQYARWLEAGYMRVHDDDEIDFAQLRREIVTEAETYSPLEIAFDPWRALGLEQELTAEGFTMVKIPQTVGNFSDPMNELQASHLSGRLKHDANPILNWMAGNLVAREDTNGNKKPRREIERNKIDGQVALLMAMNRALAHKETGGYVTGRLLTI